MPFRREHDWPPGVDPPVPYPVECQACGFELGADVEPLPLCPGEQTNGGPTRRKPLRQVSPNREEKRKKRGVYGALCDHVRGSTCCVPGCRAPSDPAHVESVGSGHGDFARRDEMWVGNVVPLCRTHHRQYDGEVGGGSGDDFEDEHDVDVQQAAFVVGMVWMKREGVDPDSPVHPYRQLE